MTSWARPKDGASIAVASASSRGLPRKSPSTTDRGVGAEDDGVWRAVQVHRRGRLLRRQALDVGRWGLAWAKGFIDVGDHRFEGHAGRAQQVGATRDAEARITRMLEFNPSMQPLTDALPGALIQLLRERHCPDGKVGVRVEGRRRSRPRARDGGEAGGGLF